MLLADNTDYLFAVFYKNATYLNTVPVDANIFDIKVYGDGASNTNHSKHAFMSNSQSHV